MNPSHISSLLQPFVAASATSFTRHHTDGYASSQELVPATRHDGFRFREEI